jgi:hypothetical protein
MSEKRVYQEKMLNSEKEIVICNWERQEGKTYSIFRKIMKNKNGKYLYISPFNPIALKDCFKEYTYNEKDNIKLYKSLRDKDFIEFNNGNKIEVFYIKPNTQFRGCRNIEIAFFDECYINKEYIDSILKPMDVKQVYCMITNGNIEYIDSRQIKTEQEKMKECYRIASKDQLMNNFIDASIVKLINEFSLVPQNEKTTLTRNSLLDMIMKLQTLRK